MVIDFHSHILPGIDDGSRNREMSVQMLQAAAEQGIDVMVATPHFYADSMSIERFLRHREEALQKVLSCQRQEQILIICGAEVAFFSGISRAEGIEQLRIGDTNLMLLEMPFRAWSDRDLYEVERLVGRGLTPVIAHVERFYPFQKDKGMISALMEMPVYIQMNAECLLSWRSRRLPVKLFRTGAAHLLGSDCHNVSSRPQNLAEGRAILERKAGRDCLEEMDRLGAALLGDEIAKC